MIKQSRKLVLDVFDYSNHKLCTLYDSSSDVCGQAYDVFVITKRNGWRELQFSIPSTIETENGIEPNYRMDYIQADYRIRLIDDDGTDWFLITEPTFTHKGHSKDVSIKAGHISQLLKTKNLGLEFSDEEGNNVGTAEELLTTILEGTGWTVGNVTTFYEDNDPSKVKVRSLQASAKSGAFKLISSMCDLFEAKPVYHGDTKTVDILPINPFAAPKNGGLPDVSTADGVIELAYSYNVKNVSRKLNSENMVSKLYAYGSYGDKTNGYCGIDECYHTEYVFVTSSQLSANTVYYFSVEDDSGTTIYRQFKTDRDIPAGSKIIYSFLDPASMMYVWIQSSNSSTFEEVHSTYWDDISDDDWDLVAEQMDDQSDMSGKAYLVEQGSAGTQLPISSSNKEIVRNWFSFVMDFEYFQDVNLLTDDGLQMIAGFQRFAYGCHQLIYNKSLEYSNALLDLSATIGDVDFCKLDVSAVTAVNDTIKLTLDKTTYSDGIIYRSDYDKNPKKHFLWRPTAEIKANGDPKTTGASMIFIIHDTTPVKWTKGYLKALDDDEDPTYLTFHIDSYANNYDLISTSSKFYLFGSNDINGWLGAFEINDEANLTAIQNKTKVVTVEHNIGFGTTVPSVTPITNTTVDDNNPAWYKIEEYGWFWKYYENDTLSELYFCYYDHYGTNTERQFRRVFVQNTAPVSPYAYNYWFDWKTSKLYRYVNNTWVYLGADPEVKVTSYFGSVYKACLTRDKYYKGVPQYLTYTVPTAGLAAGNYYIADDYGTFYVFTTIDSLSQGAKLSYDTDDVWVEQLTNGDLSPLQADLTMEAGTIDKATGALIDNMMKSRSKNYIAVTPGQDYSFSGLSSAFPLTVYKYNSSYELVNTVSGLSGFDGTFTAETGVVYIKLGCDLSYQTFNSITGFKIQIGVIKVIESKTYRFDNVNYHPENNYNNISEAGSISSTGSFVDDDTASLNSCRTKGYISVYPNNTYNITNGSYQSQALNFTIHCYNYNKVWLRKYDSISGTSGLITTDADVYYLKIVSQKPSGAGTDPWYTLFNQACANLSIRNTCVNNTIIIQDKNYVKLTPINKSGEVKGIVALTDKFSILSDEVYITKYSALVEAQNILNQFDADMQKSLGDMYREGYWQKNDYVNGDEDKLYQDALDTIKKISRPEATYTIDYLDLYSSDNNVADAAAEQTNVVLWPDLSIASAAHLIDPGININCWAYIDTIQKCYDKPWQTKISINTELTTLTQHTFADVMTNIANVASNMKAKESIIDRASVLTSSGTLAAARLEGAINTSKLRVFGGASTMYTDDNGNMVFESADGTSAMTLTGAGFAIASSKDENGDWNFRSFGTGDGFSADEIITGYLSAERIEAGSITVDKLTSSLGEELELSSNKAVILAAKSADHLENSYIEIATDHLTMKAGGKLNILADSELNVEANGTATIKANGELNVANSGDVNVQSGGNINIQSGGNINVQAGGDFNILSGGNLTVASGGKLNISSNDIQLTSSTTLADAFATAGLNLLPDSKKERTSTASSFLSIEVGEYLQNYVGETITVSFDIKGQYAQQFQVYAYQSSGISIGETHTFTMPTTNFERLSFSTTVTQYPGQLNNGVMAFYDTNANQVFTVRNVKIELGNIATYWTPSPQDPADSFDNGIVEITTSGVSISGGKLEFTANSEISFESSGTFNVFAVDDNSVIKFGGTQQNPNFSLGAGGTIKAINGYFDHLEVKNSNLVSSDVESLTSSIVVSDTQPQSGSNVLWIQPITQGTTTMKDFILASATGDLEMSGSDVTKTLTGFTNSSSVGFSGPYTYGVKFSIYNYFNTCTSYRIVVVLTDGTSSATVYDAVTNEWVRPGDYFNVDTLHSPASSNVDLTNTSSLSMSVTLQRWRDADPIATGARFEVNQNFIIRCAGTGSQPSAVQTCNVYYVP